MSSTITGKSYSKTHFHNFFGKPYLWVVFIFILFFSSWGVMGQTPNYNHIEGKNLDLINITLEDIFFGTFTSKINRIILSVDSNPEGEVFVLTFGNGIKKVGPSGSLIDFIPNQNNRLSSPMDFAINREGKFFIATNESNRRFIRVYSPTGVYLADETLGDGTYGTGVNKFKGPVGLAFDKNDRLYIADHYIGDEDPPKPSAIKIYQKDINGIYKNNLLKEFDNVQGILLNFPYRLAVNSQGLIYVSELGQEEIAKVKILQLDSNLNPTKIDEISGVDDQIGSPGSIIIDKFDFAFIADFGNKVSLTKVLAAADDPFALIAVFEDVKEGIEKNIFNINIYNPNRSFRTKISDEIDFVIDLAIDHCGILNVNNGNWYGTTSDAYFDFDLEVYQRSPGYDTEKPTLVECPPAQTGTLTSGKFRLLDYRELAEFKDNCDTNLTLEQSPAPDTEISQTTEVTITAKDASGNISNSCIFSVIIEEATDNNSPTAEPDLYSVWEDNVLEVAAEDGVLLNDTDTDGDDLIAVLDRTTNYGYLVFREDGSFTYTSNQDFNGTDTFTYFAYDGQVNSAQPVLVEIIIKAIPDILCETSFTLQLDANGEAFLLKEDLYDVDQGNVQFSLNKEDFTCEDLGENTVTLSYTYTIPDEGSFTDSCEIQIIVVDNIEPTLSCPENINESIAFGEEGRIVDYTLPVFDDNCSATIEQTEGLASGSVFPKGTTTNTFVVTDDSNNTTICSFTVTIVEETKVEDAIFQNCESNISLITDPNECGAIVTFSIPTASDASGSVTVIQTEGPSSGESFQLGTTEVVFEATGSNGKTVECRFTVSIIDNEDPIINCPDPIVVDVDPGETTKVVNFQPPTGSDNCGVDNVVQTEGFTSGSQFPIGVTKITFIATDGAGNTASCSFTVTVNPETATGNSAPIANNDTYTTDQDVTLNVPESDGVLKNDTDVENDPLTATLVSTTTNGVLTLASNGSFTYVPDAEFSGSDSFTYVANDREDDSNIATVTILVEAPNGQNPPVTQDDNYSIFMNETLDVPAPGILENDSFESVTSIRLLIDTENGTLTLNNDGSFIYIPDSGFTGEDSFRYLILDGGMESSSATVTITVEPRPTQNEAPVAYDDFYEIQQNGVLVVDAPGILGNDTDANADVLTASVGSVTGSGSFEFNGNGSFKYTPLPGFTGAESFTYTANDGSLNSNVATVTITVNGSAASDFACKNEVTLQLDATGNVSLQASDLYTGDPGDREFTLSTSGFDCANIGENSVELNYTESEGSGSCTIKVIIEDNLAPEIQAQNIIVSLDSFGFASITPEMIDTGTSDNCEVAELSLDILDFSCENLGLNTVELTAKDTSGNTSTQTVNVNITGNCKETPISAIKYIFIYPNPTQGPFTFEVPTGWVIEKADVFDYRGRYITTVEFPMGEPYNMNLSTLQTAVYTLHLTTNQGNKIIRVIIR